MKTPLILAVGALTLLTKLAGGSEIITLVAESPGNQYGYSQTITLEQGDSAEVTGGGTHGGLIELTVGGHTFIENIIILDAQTGRPLLFNRLNVAGPATMRLRVSSPGGSAYSDFATVSITRIGAPTNPAAIPIEAGSNFNVILESSSDLINWQPANPGIYSGTEPRRFFRVRIVRLGV